MRAIRHTQGASTLLPFDYSALGEAAADAQAIVERFRTRSRALILDTGRELLAVKDRLDHGLFMKWVASELGINPRTAQNYMMAATAFGDKSEIVSHLPPTTIYALSAPTVPSSFREEVVGRLEAGERLSANELTHFAKRASARSAQTTARRERKDWTVEQALKKLPLKERKALDTPEKRKARADEMIADQRRRAAAQAARDRKESDDRIDREAQAADELGDLLADRLDPADAQRVVDLFGRAGTFCVQRVTSRLRRKAPVAA